jgi:hypothetical protein
MKLVRVLLQIVDHDPSQPAHNHLTGRAKYPALKYGLFTHGIIVKHCCPYTPNLSQASALRKSIGRKIRFFLATFRRFSDSGQSKAGDVQ